MVDAVKCRGWRTLSVMLGLSGLMAGPVLALSAADEAQRFLDAQLKDTLPTLEVAAPGAPMGPVVPSQVLRWRQEATAWEHGENGLERDASRAAALYCQAARHGDAESQFALAWMLTNGRGIERDDAAAAHLFTAAAEQGMPQAQRMARQLGTARGEPPPCLEPPEPVMSAKAVAKPAPAARQAAARRDVTQHPLYARAPKPIAEYVRLVAPDYQLPAQLVLAIISAESAFNPNAVSPKNAQGLMQLIPATASRFKVRDIMDPAQNIRGGMAYLRWLLAFFEGNVPLAVAAYNAGEGAVERYRGVPPYAETRAYVLKVMALFDEGPLLPYDSKVTQPSSRLSTLKLASQ